MCITLTQFNIWDIKDMFRGVEFLKNVVENMLEYSFDCFLQYAPLKQPLINIFNIVDNSWLLTSNVQFLSNRN